MACCLMKVDALHLQQIELQPHLQRLSFWGEAEEAAIISPSTAEAPLTAQSADSRHQRGHQPVKHSGTGRATE